MNKITIYISCIFFLTQGYVFHNNAFSTRKVIKNFKYLRPLIFIFLQNRQIPILLRLLMLYESKKRFHLFLLTIIMASSCSLTKFKRSKTPRRLPRLFISDRSRS